MFETKPIIQVTFFQNLIYVQMGISNAQTVTVLKIDLCVIKNIIANGERTNEIAVNLNMNIKLCFYLKYIVHVLALIVIRDAIDFL